MRSVPYPVKRPLCSNRHTGTKPHEAQSRLIGRLANTDPLYIDKFYVKQYYGGKMTHYNNILHKKLFLYNIRNTTKQVFTHIIKILMSGTARCPEKRSSRSAHCDYVNSV